MAHQVKQQGDQLNASYQAWQNQTAQATKGSGKNIRSAYNSFRDFYDQEKEFRIFLYLIQIKNADYRWLK